MCTILNWHKIYHDFPLQPEIIRKNPSDHSKWPIHQHHQIFNPRQPPPPIYEHQITHAAEIKFINDRYITPVTIELGSSNPDNSINLPMEQQKIFAALKILDPSFSITINVTTINRPREFPMGIDYTKYQIITDKKPRFPRFLFIMNFIRRSQFPL